MTVKCHPICGFTTLKSQKLRNKHSSVSDRKFQSGLWRSSEALLARMDVWGCPLEFERATCSDEPTGSQSHPAQAFSRPCWAYRGSQARLAAPPCQSGQPTRSDVSLDSQRCHSLFEPKRASEIQTTVSCPVLRTSCPFGSLSRSAKTVQFFKAGVSPTGPSARSKAVRGFVSVSVVEAFMVLLRKEFVLLRRCRNFCITGVQTWLDDS